MNEGGIGFMMAPRYHPAMKIVSPVRKKLKVRTVFNILGPMLNPARAPFSVLGVYKEDLVNTSTERRFSSSSIIIFLVPYFHLTLLHFFKFC